MRAPAFYFRPPGLASRLLAPAGAIYGAAAALRMRRRGTHARVPVVCIGNLTLGGAGKTPTALAIGKLLGALGERPAFLSRGYGGRDAGPVVVSPKRHHAAEVGDEPLLLARAYPTIMARDRVSGARLAADLGASVLVLDDGFQNPSLTKDVSLVVHDGASGIGNGSVFPAGPLRAPLRTQLRLAQGLVRVGATGGRDPVTSLAAEMELPIFEARLVPDAATALILAGKKALAFAGIGHPAKFFATLAEMGVEAVEKVSFPDHHMYTAEDAHMLLQTAAARGLILLTTEKDLVRMGGNPALGNLESLANAIPVRLEFSDEVAIKRWLGSALAKAHEDAQARARSG